MALRETSLVPFLFLSLIIVYDSIIKNVCIYLVYFIKISTLFDRVLIHVDEDWSAFFSSRPKDFLSFSTKSMVQYRQKRTIFYEFAAWKTRE